MPYTEDAQPNEVRHSRKGNGVVPTIRTTPAFRTQEPALGQGSRRGRGHGRGRGRGFAPSASNHDDARYNSSHNGRGGQRPHRRDRGGAHPTTTHQRDAPPHQRFGTLEGGGRMRGHPSKRQRLELRKESHVQPPRQPPLVQETSISDHIKLEVSDRECSPAGPGLYDWATCASLASPPSTYDDVEPRMSVESTGSPLVHNSLESLCFLDQQLPSGMRQDVESPCDNATCAELLKVEENTPPLVHSPPLLVTRLPSPELASPEQAADNTPNTASQANGSHVSSLLIVSEDAMETASRDIGRAPRFRSGRLRFQIPVYSRVEDETGEASNPSDDPQTQSLSRGPDSSSNAHNNFFDQSAVHAVATHVRVESPEPDPSSHDSVDVVQTRTDAHDKPRKLVMLASGGILSITMRGSLDLVEQRPIRCTALRTAMSGDGNRPLVDDACVLTRADGRKDIALGRVGDTQQLSLVHIEGKKVLDKGTYDRPKQPEKKGGISAISSTLQSDTFVTGGYDHLVHWWTMQYDRPAEPVRLAIKHTSVVQSLLALRDTSNKLLSGSADCSISVYDIASERVVNLLKLSNSVYRLHPVPSPSCVLVELGHRELQFEIRDLRVAPAAPVVRFGYPNTKVHGRYTRGDIRDNLFACGGSERDGCVRLWDLRKPAEVMRTVQCFPGHKATQVVLGDTQMVTCSEDHQLVFMQLEGEST